MNKSNFCVVGTQKSATTWLFEVLNEHPEAFVPTMKEVHFHCPPERCRHSTRQRGLEWYDSLFSAAPKTSKAIGEMTTNYMFFEESAEWLYQQNPNLKIVILLRHPVDRAYSHYWMRKRHSPNIADFDEIVREKQSTIIQRGYYIDQIERYHKLFGADQVGVWFHEDIKSSPHNVIKEIFSFLNIDPTFKPSVLYTTVGETKKIPGIGGFLLYKVISPAINAPIIRSFWRFVRANSNAKQLGNKLLGQKQSGNNYPPLDLATRRKWVEHYKPWNDRLFRLLNRKIESWSE